MGATQPGVQPRQMRNPDGDAGIQLTVRVFFSRYIGSSVPVSGNAGWIPAPGAGLLSEAPLNPPRLG
jgi:hypothetical protein